MPLRSPHGQLRLVWFLPLMAASLLLLIPLCALKWRADHPPVSAMDKELRTIVAATKIASGSAWGEQTQQLTGDVHNSLVFVIKDKAELRELTETLRCDEQPVNPNVDVRHDPALNLAFYYREPGAKQWRTTVFSYWRTAQGSYLTRWKLQGWIRGRCARVRPDFVARFERFVWRVCRRTHPS